MRGKKPGFSEKTRFLLALSQLFERIEKKALQGLARS
jgi:hypothetical protein